MAKTAADAMRADAKLDPVFARALREALFWLLMALALLMLIALASFDASDRSFSYTGEPGQISNLIGPLGARLADVLFMLFGWPAFLFPAAIGFSAWTGLKRARANRDRGGPLSPCASSESLLRSRRVAGLQRFTSLAARCRPVPAASSAASSARVSRRSLRSSAPRSCCSQSGSPACSFTPGSRGSRSWTISDTGSSRAPPGCAGASRRRATTRWAGNRARRARLRCAKCRSVPRTHTAAYRPACAAGGGGTEQACREGKAGPAFRKAAVT